MKRKSLKYLFLPVVSVMFLVLCLISFSDFQSINDQSEFGLSTKNTQQIQEKQASKDSENFTSTKTGQIIPAKDMFQHDVPYVDSGSESQASDPGSDDPANNTLVAGSENPADVNFATQNQSHRVNNGDSPFNEPDIYWGYQDAKDGKVLWIASAKYASENPGVVFDKDGNKQWTQNVLDENYLPGWWEGDKKEERTIKPKLTTIKICDSINPSYTKSWFSPAWLTEVYFYTPVISKIEGLANINMSKVQDSSFMFCGVGLNTKTTIVNSWTLDNNKLNLSSVTNARAMFCSSNINAGFAPGTSWNIYSGPNLTDTYAMFQKCYSSSSTDASNNYELDLSELNMSNVHSCGLMFNGIRDASKIIMGPLDMTSLNNNTGEQEGFLPGATSMFCYCQGLQVLDLTSWINTDNVSTDGKVLTNMFANSADLTTIYVPNGTDWSSATCNNMFTVQGQYGSSSLKGGLGTIVDDTGATNARIDGGEVPSPFNGNDVINPGYFTTRYEITYDSDSLSTEVGETVVVETGYKWDVAKQPDSISIKKSASTNYDTYIYISKNTDPMQNALEAIGENDVIKLNTNEYVYHSGQIHADSNLESTSRVIVYPTNGTNDDGIEFYVKDGNDDARLFTNSNCSIPATLEVPVWEGGHKFLSYKTAQDECGEAQDIFVLNDKGQFDFASANIEGYLQNGKWDIGEDNVVRVYATWESSYTLTFTGDGISYLNYDINGSSKSVDISSGPASYTYTFNESYGTSLDFKITYISQKTSSNVVTTVQVGSEALNKTISGEYETQISGDTTIYVKSELGDLPEIIFDANDGTFVESDDTDNTHTLEIPIGLNEANSESNDVTELKVHEKENESNQVPMANYRSGYYPMYSAITQTIYPSDLFKKGSYNIKGIKFKLSTIGESYKYIQGVRIKLGTVEDKYFNSEYQWKQKGDGDGYLKEMYQFDTTSSSSYLNFNTPEQIFNFNENGDVYIYNCVDDKTNLVIDIERSIPTGSLRYNPATNYYETFTGSSGSNYSSLYIGDSDSPTKYYNTNITPGDTNSNGTTLSPCVILLVEITNKTLQALNGSVDLYDGTSLKSVPKAAKSGFVFDGYWTTKDEGGSQVLDANGNLIPGVSGFTTNGGLWNVSHGSKPTLYARWKSHKVTFDDSNPNILSYTYNGVTYKPGDSIGVNEEQISVGVNTKQGYTLTGVVGKSNDGDIVFKYNGNLWTSTSAITRDITVTPQPKTFTVTFDLNGHGDNFTQEVAEGSYALRPQNPLASGYQFDEWYTAPTGGDLVQFEDITSTTIVYAHWASAKYRVTWKANGGYWQADGSEIKYTAVEKNSHISAYDPEPIRENKIIGKYLNGTEYTWFKNPECTEQWDFYTDTVTSSMTLYAAWHDDNVCSANFANDGGVSSYYIYYNTIDSGSKTGSTTLNDIKLGDTFSFKLNVNTNYAVEYVRANIDGVSYPVWYDESSQRWSFTAPSDKKDAVININFKANNSSASPELKFDANGGTFNNDISDVTDYSAWSDKSTEKTGGSSDSSPISSRVYKDDYYNLEKTSTCEMIYTPKEVLPSTSSNLFNKNENNDIPSKVNIDSLTFIQDNDAVFPNKNRKGETISYTINIYLVNTEQDFFVDGSTTTWLSGVNADNLVYSGAPVEVDSPRAGKQITYKFSKTFEYNTKNNLGVVFTRTCSGSGTYPYYYSENPTDMPTYQYGYSPYSQSDKSNPRIVTTNAGSNYASSDYATLSNLTNYAAQQNYYLPYVMFTSSAKNTSESTWECTYGRDTLDKEKCTSVVAPQVTNTAADSTMFDGYWTQADGGEQVVDSQYKAVPGVEGYTNSEGKWVITSNKTLYAHWKGHKITFNGDSSYIDNFIVNGRPVSLSNSVPINEGNEVRFSVNPKSGYLVSGVEIDGQQQGIKDEYIYTAEDKDVTVYATGMQDGYMFYFLDRNGDVCSSQGPMQIGQTVTKPDDPSIHGAVFDGWYYDEEFMLPVSWPITVSADLNKYTYLYSKWSPLPVVVSYNANGGSFPGGAKFKNYGGIFGEKIFALPTEDENPSWPAPDHPFGKKLTADGDPYYWFKDAACTEPWDFENDTIDKLDTGSADTLTLYAGYTDTNISKVSFDVETEYIDSVTTQSRTYTNKSFVVNAALNDASNPLRFSVSPKDNCTVKHLYVEYDGESHAITDFDEHGEFSYVPEAEFVTIHIKGVYNLGNKDLTLDGNGGKFTSNNNDYNATNNGFPVLTNVSGTSLCEMYFDSANYSDLQGVVKISSITFNCVEYSKSSTSYDANSFRIYCGTTSKKGPTGNFDYDTGKSQGTSMFDTCVYSGAITLNAGMQTINFTTPYNFNNPNNDKVLVVAVSKSTNGDYPGFLYKSSNTTTNNSVIYANTYLSDAERLKPWYWYNDTSIAGTLTKNIPDVTFGTGSDEPTLTKYSKFADPDLYNNEGRTEKMTNKPIPVNDNKGFDGFWTEATGGVQVVDQNWNLIPGVEGYTDAWGRWILNGNHTIYAHWKNYNVTFNAADNNVDYFLCNGQKYSSGQSIATDGGDLTFDVVCKNGYGVNQVTASVGTVIPVQKGTYSIINVQATTTITASSKEAGLKAIFKSEDNKVFYEVKGLEPGDSFKIPSGLPERIGYNFAGTWNYNSQIYHPEDTFTVPGGTSSDMIFMANWIAKSNITVTWDANGGSWDGTETKESKNQTFGTLITIVPEDPARGEDGHYSFNGWYKDKSCTVPFNPSADVIDSENLILYARWTNNWMIDITFRHDTNTIEAFVMVDGTVVTDGNTYSCEKLQKIKFNVVSKDGYTITSTYANETVGTISRTDIGIDENQEYLIYEIPETVSAVEIWATAEATSSAAPEMEIDAKGGDISSEGDIYQKSIWGKQTSEGINTSPMATNYESSSWSGGFKLTNYASCEMIYPSSTISAGTISELSFHCMDEDTIPESHIKIYMFTTKSNSFSSKTNWLSTVNWEEACVYEGDKILGTKGGDPDPAKEEAWEKYTLDKAFTYNPGEGNLAIVIARESTDWKVEGSGFQRVIRWPVYAADKTKYSNSVLATPVADASSSSSRYNDPDYLSTSSVSGLLSNSLPIIRLAYTKPDGATRYTQFGSNVIWKDAEHTIKANGLPVPIPPAGSTFLGYFVDISGLTYQVSDVEGQVICNVPGVTNSYGEWIFKSKIKIYAKYSTP